MSEKDDVSDQVKKWKAMIRMVWDNPTEKEALIQNPREVLAKHDLSFPESQTIQIHENTDQIRHFVLPQKPDKVLSDEILSHIVAGFHYGGE